MTLVREHEFVPFLAKALISNDGIKLEGVHRPYLKFLILWLNRNLLRHSCRTVLPSDW